MQDHQNLLPLPDQLAHAKTHISHIETGSSAACNVSACPSFSTFFDMQPGGGPPSSSNSSITREESERSERSDRSSSTSSASSTSSTSSSLSEKSAAFTQLCSKALDHRQNSTKIQTLHAFGHVDVSVPLSFHSFHFMLSFPCVDYGACDGLWVPLLEETSKFS